MTMYGIWRKMSLWISMSPWRPRQRMRTTMGMAIIVVIACLIGDRFPGVDSALASMGEPDWFISKADLVDEIYSYEPYLPVGGDLRSLFSRQAKQPLQYPSSSNLRPQVHMQPPQFQPQPKYAKFNIQDKKDNQAHIQYLPPQSQQQIRLGPMYEHMRAATPPPPPPHMNPAPQLPLAPPQPPPPPPPPPTPPPRVGYPDATAVDKQTIVWPEDQKVMMNGDESALRFLIHKPGDEGEIKKALVEDGEVRGQEVRFIEGPTLRIQRHQKVYLPPKKKTVVYILLKEPQILTDVEVVGPTEEPVPEVFITYQKSDGNVRTKHYSPDAVKGDKYLNQLRLSSLETPQPQPPQPTTVHNQVKRTIQPVYQPQNSHINHQSSQQQVPSPAAAPSIPPTTVTCPTVPTTQAASTPVSPTTHP